MSSALKQWESYRVRHGTRVDLSKFPPGATKFCDDKRSAQSELKRLREKIDTLTAVLAAENQHSLLVILQGMDASGKDGAVKKVFTGVNPQHCHVVSFKPPDREEQEHDYLWRVVRALPARGELGIFNRSQYEDVVTLEARGEIPRSEASMRLRQIADLERTWAENGMTIRKLFLHISRAEQSRRFQSRLDKPEKHWKLEASDFSDHKLWPRFQSIYEHLLSRTLAPHAPWYIIPADHKWYRDLAVAGIVLGALKAMKPRLPKPNLDPAVFKL
ncbi:MAG TPA: PPK2 family polyphosphate kinase [Terracidiphilus sp.]|nr:PPK2 family polyphosphate kinase [Terracidiphilus sp.]